MGWLPLVASFVLGTLLASFIGLVAGRLRTGAPILYGRSVCDACGVTLPPLALVPILSWLLMQGRCLSCRARVAPDSTITELLLGVFFVLAYLKLGFTPLLPLVLIALTLLAGLVLYDLAHTILPPVLLWPFVGVCALVAILSSPDTDTLLFTVASALILGAVIALVHVASSGRAMGLADAPLVVGLALLVGWNAFSGFLFTFWIGGLVGITLLALRALGTTIESEVPFAPFLAAGFLLAYFTTWDAFTLVGMLTAAFGV